MSTTYAATATINARLQVRYTRSDELGTATETVDAQYARSLASGVDEDQVDIVSRRTMNAGGAGGPSAFQVIYFATGLGNAISDAWGRGLQFATVRAVYIKNLSTDPDDMLTVQDSSFGPIPDGVQIPPGGMLFMTHPGEGWDVVEECSITLANSNPVDHSFDIEFVAVGVKL